MHPQSQVITRPGLEGGEIWRTKLQSIPFPVTSVVDLPNVKSCYREHKKYIDTHYSDDLLEFIWRDADIGATYGLKFHVLDVRIIEIFGLLKFLGGLNPPSLGWLTCEWTLVPIPDK